MQRRLLLTALGASIAGSVAGCLGSLSSYDTVPDDYEPPDGYHQVRYDARKSNHAAGLGGPTSEPTNHRIHPDTRGTPLTTEEALFASTWSADFDGNTRWEGSPHVDGSRPYPALHGDSVVTASTDAEVLWTVSQADGTEQWRTGLSAQPSYFEALTVLDDHAYFSTLEGVGSVDLVAHEEAWQADVHAEYPHVVNGHRWATPAATPQHVFMLNPAPPHRDYEGPKLLYAVDRDTGELDWTVDLGFAAKGSMGVTGPYVGDRYVFVTALADENPDADEAYDSWVRTIAIDPVDGEIAWTRYVPGKNTNTRSAVAEGQFYISHGGVPSGDPALLSALDTADGSVEWTIEMPHFNIRPAVTDDLVYVITEFAQCLAIDPSDGTIAWRIDLPDLEGVPEFGWHNPHRPPPPPIVQNERVFVYLGEGDLLELW